jgi:GT2 family glycosyltransferase
VPLPTVTIVFLVHNRREELRTSLRQMLSESDYPAELVDVIVVDNASGDGVAEMMERDFPGARLIRRATNCGVSGWNDGFAVAAGDCVLALDDDCYLPPDGLRLAVEAAGAQRADLVSFGVRSSFDSGYRFDRRYRTGLLTFWGCAVLMRREVLAALRGYDPEIFVWANELEFMLRFFDRGFRHLHMPEIQAVHMKMPKPWREYLPTPAYRINARNFAYVAAKLLQPRDAAEALVALLAVVVRDGLRTEPRALRAIPQTLAGFVRGLRRREPVEKADVSRTFRRNLESFASPWWVSRPLPELVRAFPGELARRALRHDRDSSRPTGRRDEYYAARARYFPTAADTLKF